MLRKLASLSFILVMIAIMALKHPALAYCLCEHKVMPLSECSHLSKHTEDTPPACPHCAAIEAKEEAPPQNCTLEISFDVGEFYWQDNTDQPQPQYTAATPLLPTAEITLPAPHIEYLGTLARQNAPPPRAPLPEMTGVYRL